MNRFSNTNSPGLLKLTWQFLAVFIMFTGLAGCGGSAGSSTAGLTGVTATTAATENAAILAVLDKSTDSAAQAILPAGADTFSMATFWEAQVLKGFTKVGALRGYAYQDYPNITSLSNLETNTSDTTKTLLVITHVDHRAKTGDIVTLSGVTSDALDIPFRFLNGTFEITLKDSNSYYIKIPYASVKPEKFLLNVNLFYKYKECSGQQTVKQTPALATVPVTNFDGYESRVATYTVENSLVGCSPPLATFITTKYYAVNNPRSEKVLKYPFLGQRVKDGDFASLEKTFDLPATPLKSGDKGSIGTMKFYKESNKASLTGTALLSYEILKYTTNAVFIAINLDYYNDNNTLVSNSTEIYGRDPAIDKEYKLIRMSVKYNNPRKNEIIVE
jgi:hypothetical protein